MKKISVNEARFLLASLLLCTLTFLQGCERSSDSSSSSNTKTDSSLSTSSPQILFEEATETWKLAFHHESGAKGEYYFPEIMGGGVAIFDFDQDGYFDLYFTNGHTQLFQREKDSSEIDRTNQLFRQTEAGVFQNVTRQSGLGDTGYGMGVAIGDVNNDGYPDLYLTNWGADKLYLNQKDGTFRDMTRESGLHNLRWGTSATFFDFDRDGWLDLFVTNYVDYAPRECTQLSGTKQDYCAPHLFAGTPDKLFRNRTGDNKPTLQQNSDEERHTSIQFEDVSLKAGISRATGPGLGVLASDFNSDGFPDLYVANDQAGNFLWINSGKGTFEDQAILRGVAYGFDGSPQASMGIASGDLDGDGRLDLYLTHLEGEHNAIYSNQGETGYQEQSHPSGLGKSSLAMTGFGTTLFDIEHDGDLDVLLVNGKVKRPANVGYTLDFVPGSQRVPSSFWDPYREFNQILLNNGSGVFQPIAHPQEKFLSVHRVSRALASGDLDNDGDLDLVVTNLGESAQIFLNKQNGNASTNQHRWVMLRLLDPALGNRDVYGSQVEISHYNRKWIREVNPSMGYLTSNDPRIHVGLGRFDSAKGVEGQNNVLVTVHWIDGLSETFHVKTNTHQTLHRGTGRTLEQE